MSRTRLAFLAALAVLILAMAGCSKEEPAFTADDQIPEDRVESSEPAEGEGAEGGGDAAGEVQFVAEDIKFASAPSTVPAGMVTFELVNDGGAPHDVTIEEMGDETVVKADGGKSATGEVELEPGTYTYFCSVPGHRSAGMEGTFTVE